jgi:hypothetical protein
MTRALKINFQSSDISSITIGGTNNHKTSQPAFIPLEQDYSGCRKTRVLTQVSTKKSMSSGDKKELRTIWKHSTSRDGNAQCS